MRRKFVLVAAVILLVVSAGCIGDTDLGQQQNEQAAGNGEGTPSEQSTIQVPTSKEEIEYIDINITADEVRPELATGEPPQMLRWRNTNDFPVYLYFAWMRNNLTVEPGGLRTMLIDGQTRYSVYRNDTRELVGEGTVRIE